MTGSARAPLHPRPCNRHRTHCQHGRLVADLANAATLGGQLQVPPVSGKGITTVRPADGSVLWQHDWRGDAITLPAVISDGDVLLGSGRLPRTAP